MPKLSSNTIDSYDTQIGYHPSGTKLYEHTLFDGRLVSTQIFSQSGSILHELTISSSHTHAARDFRPNGKLKLAQEQSQSGVGFNAQVYNDCDKLIYHGGFRSNSRHGSGIEYFDSGAPKTDGSWKANKLHGKAIKFRPNGRKKYEGNFEGGIRQGYGIFYYKNGNKCHDGNFYAKLREGYGVSFYENGNQEYDGFWKNDDFQGFGKTYRENGIIQREGYFSHAGNYFIGKWYNDFGNLRYEGEMLNIRSHGQGEEFYENGNVKYAGTLVDGERAGHGVLYWRNGNIKYKGHWNRNVIDGLGELYDFYGNSKFKGQWKNGAIQEFILNQDQLKSGQDILALNNSKIFFGFTKIKTQSGTGVIYNNSGDKLCESKWAGDYSQGFSRVYSFAQHFCEWPVYLGNKRFNMNNFVDDLTHIDGARFDYRNGKLRIRGQNANLVKNGAKFWAEYDANGKLVKYYSQPAGCEGDSLNHYETRDTIDQTLP